VPAGDVTQGSPPVYDVVAIGNALVDVIGSVPEEFLVRENVTRGSMTLVDAQRSTHLFSQLPETVQTSGGSAANTAHGLASLGGKAGFIGKVADDAFGRAFGHDMDTVGVGFHPGTISNTEPTGACIIAVTPDGQRSMSTFLGAASLLEPSDISREVVASGSVLFLEGYLFDRDAAKDAFRVAAKYAHESGRKVSLTLSDSFCVDRHREDFMDLILNDIDILFCNEFELASLYQTLSFDDALTQLRSDCEFAAVTRDKRGSLVINGGDLVVIDAVPVEQVVDATGAGDMYAAGFLYGFTRGMSIESCGHLGSLAASEVITHVGPRPLVSLASLIPAHLR
jgi:sugar/nucleoside kinase (ribokinase family)